VGKNVILVGKVVQIRGDEALIDADGNVTAHLNRVSFPSPPPPLQSGSLPPPPPILLEAVRMRQIETSEGTETRDGRWPQRETSLACRAFRTWINLEETPRLTTAHTTPPGGPSHGRQRRPDHRQSQPGPLHQGPELDGPGHGRR
jgi:hypothetical protein